MLSERLKNKELFSDKREENEESEEKEAVSMRSRKALDGVAHDLVILMRFAERNGMTRQEIENYVLNRLEAHEQRIYGMDNGQFMFYVLADVAQSLFEEED